jgi:hypothetical protein
MLEDITQGPRSSRSCDAPEQYRLEKLAKADLEGVRHCPGRTGRDARYRPDAVSQSIAFWASTTALMAIDVGNWGFRRAHSCLMAGAPICPHRAGHGRFITTPDRYIAGRHGLRFFSTFISPHRHRNVLKARLRAADEAMPSTGASRSKTSTNCGMVRGFVDDMIDIRRFKKRGIPPGDESDLAP